MRGAETRQRSRSGYIAGAAALTLGSIAGAGAFQGAEGPKEAAFRRDVLPVLVKNCFGCHGPKLQMGGLRLDSREAALKGNKLGAALVPGKPDQSPLVTVLRYQGKVKMPPSGPLKPAEVAAITRWVAEGAVWPADAGKRPLATAKPGEPLGDQWAFTAPTRPQLPAVKATAWVKNPIDRFILATLEKQGLKPSPYADRRTLIRRVSLDIVGLPPTPAEVEAFLNDRAPGAYERVVDRLLASPHYGERMAQHWLDLARYADSDGYHDDTTRYMWKYRDYVIRAFNQNTPFDRFTVEQLAGDLLPDATMEQKIASAFNRCGPTSSEGGAIPEELLAAYAIDRVNTTFTVWLGLTMQCVQCHDHKYDPLAQKEYYQLFSFFNQVPEEALYRGTDAPPTLLAPSPQQQARLDELAAEIATLQKEMAPQAAPDSPAEKDRQAAVKKKLDAANGARSTVEKESRIRIMQDVPERRPTRILLRGDYTKPGDEVQPAVPAVLGALPTGPAAANRLALAKWIIDPANPMTARVTVNRLWAMVFGAGIVRTVDDFGARGERPSHPELLDYLAVRFARGSGENANKSAAWDVKAMLRLIVTSAAYQQSSVVTPQLMAKDPQNRWLARGPRFRMQAEMLRDNALAIAGLFDRKRDVGGPSVRPYQPGDLWREVSAGDDPSKSYVQDHGPDLYRRGLYTFWKRSILYPSFAVFDAPKREVCSAFRPITNTPLQAFVTLNDTTFVEAARVLAQSLLEQPGRSFDQRLDEAYLRALSRKPDAGERQTMRSLYTESLAQYREDAKGALALASAGEFARPKELDPAEHAAWTCLCNALLNLDEVLVKE